MVNAFVKVSSEGETKGNVELKVYIQSVHNKKGSTRERNISRSLQMLGWTKLFKQDVCNLEAFEVNGLYW